MGMIQGNDAMQALLRLMSTLYAPQLLASSAWPETIRTQFAGSLLSLGKVFARALYLFLRKLQAASSNPDAIGLAHPQQGSSTCTPDSQQLHTSVAVDISP